MAAVSPCFQTPSTTTLRHHQSVRPSASTPRILRLVQLTAEHHSHVEAVERELLRIGRDGSDGADAISSARGVERIEPLTDLVARLQLPRPLRPADAGTDLDIQDALRRVDGEGIILPKGVQCRVGNMQRTREPVQAPRPNKDTPVSPIHQRASPPKPIPIASS